VHLITLSPADLVLAAALVLLLAGLSVRMRLGLTTDIIVAAVRTTVQLLLIGLVLKALFAHVNLAWIMVIALIMLLVAGREVMVRQNRGLAGWWGFGIGTASMFISSFSVTLLALGVIIGTDPWYTPQYGHDVGQYHERRYAGHGPFDAGIVAATQHYRGAFNAGSGLGTDHRRYSS